ncbi:MAG: hypothetical protein AAGC60_28380 [Acidobacteriota bacterium]
MPRPSLQAPRLPLRLSLQSPLFAFILVFVLGVLACGVFYAGHPAFFDTDASFHLAAARSYAEDGFDWAPPLRVSLLGRVDDPGLDDPGLDDTVFDDTGFGDTGFGDKELLFHLAMVPLVELWPGDAERPPLAAGRLALALFNALVLAVLAALGVRAAGAWGLLLPVWLVWSSTEFAWRLVRLRPELLALVLFCLGLWAAATLRMRLLALVATLFALSYTAVHAFCGLFALLFFWWGLARRSWRWDMALAVALGTGVGLVLHPHFPSNLDVWVVQNIRFFVDRAGLDVGTEIRPNFTDVSLMVNLGWLAGLLVLWRARRRSSAGATLHAAGRSTDDARLADAFSLAGVVFGGLYLLMSRFVVYAVPFLSLALLFTLRSRGETVGAWIPLGAGARARRVPTAVALAGCLLLSAPEALRQLARFEQATSAGPDEARFHQLTAFAAAVPAGAHVVAPWGRTALYLLWAPHGEYLNVLDPVFMASVDRDAYELQRALLDGRHADVPLAAAHLDSDHLAVPATLDGPLRARLAADPRVEVLHAASNLLVRFRPAPGFVVDGWRIVPPAEAAAALDPSASTSRRSTNRSSNWPSYPHQLEPTPRALEGFVDGARVAGAADRAGCLRFVHPGVPAGRYELAPAGATTLRTLGADGSTRTVRVGGALDAVLGHGLLVELGADSGEDSGSGGTSDHLIVDTCPSPEGTVGFYLLAR